MTATLPSALEDLVPLCAGRGDEYDTEHLPLMGRLQAAAALCRGCPVTMRACARAALDGPPPEGMVWAGVPVPHKSQRGAWHEAITHLQIAAGYARGEVPTPRRGTYTQDPLRPCKRCGKITRPSGRRLTEFPGTIARAAKGLCYHCYTTHREQS
ncbi:WhiB family transcriptional regulator [Rhodococcus ruber]|uniref:WhiB family transcriptional regulator n=1 Tax=Rhodococcus ruber TaxID=1830 RepID=UPI00265DCB57|nr:WhiB family transcriptional regulator [Rhodococcus ruber]MDO1481423.1 hypothetical protein [Rhodococcus ruber]